MAYPTAAQAAAVKGLVGLYGPPARVVIERTDAPYARCGQCTPAGAWKACICLEGGNMSRRSYSELMSQPAWLLYKDEKLVASVRASDIYTARDLFKRAGLKGNRIVRVMKGAT